MHKYLIVTLFFIFLFNNTFSQLTRSDEISAGGTGYLLFTPASYDGSKPYPVLLYLHGAQAIGPEISCSYGKGLPGALKDNPQFFDTLQMFVVAPHVKLGSKCSDRANNDHKWDVNMANEVLTDVINKKNIDENRIFGSGISLGAKGIWDYTLAFPDKLIGLVPFSGNAPITNICSLEEVAVWAFHGEADGIIPPTGESENEAGRYGGQTVVQEINKCSTKPYLPAYITLFQAKGHDGWSQVYDLSAGFNIYEWMLSLKKNVSTGYRPLVNIGPDIKLKTPTHPIEIRSFAFDPDGGAISNYTWTKVSGPSATFNANAQHLKLTNLQVGDYVFRLTVTDNDGTKNSDEMSIKVANTTTEPEITQLRLYDGSKDKGALSNGQVINLNDFKVDSLDVKAETANLNSRASVRFEVNDMRNFTSLNEDKISAGFFAGNNNHASFKPGPGEYTIRATAYADRNTRPADQGFSYQVSITFSEGPLPVKLLAFNAQEKNGKIHLTWTTTEEVNNSHFEIYQGVGQAHDMKKVAEVPRAEPNLSVNHYKHTLESAPCGQLFFQLKSIDHDAHTDHSSIVNLQRSSEDCQFRLYPNPASTGIMILEGNNLYQGMPLRIISLSGNLVREFTIPETTRSYELNLSGIPAGVYILQSDHQNIIQKIIINP